jgi:hypothetical protein
MSLALIPIYDRNAPSADKSGRVGRRPWKLIGNGLAGTDENPAARNAPPDLT